MFHKAYRSLIVDPQSPRPFFLNLLVTLLVAAHYQSRVHVHIMTRVVEADQALEDDTPPGKGACEKDEKTGGGATIGDHVQDGAKAGGLVERSSSCSVEGIEKAGNAVQQRTGAGMVGHVVE